MEAKDYWLLIAGALLGYVVNLIATYTAPSVGWAFSKLKSGFIERNKARALAGYALVWGLKSGQVDKYIYALNNWGFILVYVVFFAMCSVVALLSNDPIGKWSNLFVSRAPGFQAHLTLAPNREQACQFRSLPRRASPALA